MSHAVRAVFFDLDGTLLDTLSDIAGALNRVLAAHRLPTHPADAYRRMVGSGMRALVERAVPEEVRREIDLVERLERDAREAYAGEATANTRLYPGIAELLADLRGRGLTLGVLSNKPDAMARRVVQYFFAPSTFAAVRGQVEGMPPKPDPAGARAMLEALGVNAAQALYLGDSDVDISTALQSGMMPVGAAWGFRGGEELRRAGAAEVIAHPSELVTLVERINAGAS